MDQESFRKLLQTPKPGSSTISTSRGSLLATATSKSKQKTVDASKPAFKPRTVKKKSQATDSYRDRATERRLGLDSDYAQVEALAEDFERKTADEIDRKAVEEQRRYLGGDSTHSVLVKGLDYALFEQNRARVAASAAAEDDATLEQAFLEVSSSVPKKRTREEIVQELKAKREKSEESAEKIINAADAPLDEAKKAGKFRPIGFKPIGGDAGAKTKKKVKQKAEGERKKKRKVEASVADSPSIAASLPAPAEAGPSKPSPPPPRQPEPEPEPEPIDADFDIFADAGEYTGVDLGDDEESEGEIEDDHAPGEGTSNVPPKTGRWFETEEQERNTSPKPEPAEVSPPPGTGLPPPDIPSDKEEGEEEEERPMRLQPLASSALPSIRELLELDSAVDKNNKRRARKEKKKDKREAGDVTVDKNKIDRDYKRLKAYTDKKAAASGGGSKS